MTLIELKKSLHERIDGLDDQDFLEMMNDIIDSHEKIFVIPEFMKEVINQGLEDIKNGNVHTIEELENRYVWYLKD